MTPNDIMSEKNRARVKAVIFDLDDTLYPQQQYVFSGFRAVADYIHNLYGLDLFSDLIDLYWAGERNDLFGKALSHHFKNVEDALVRKLLYVHRTHNPRLELHQDARVCMAMLIARGVRIGLLTDGDSSIQRKKVAALELEPLIDSVVYCDDLLGSRQSFQIYEDAFEIMSLQLGVDVGEMTYVADNPHLDFVTPRRLGMGTIRIQRRKGEYAEQEPPAPEFEPHVSIPTLCMLADVLDCAQLKAKDPGDPA
ncbi:MAG: HAD family hydrolase [Lentisphaerota bacterium]